MERKYYLRGLGLGIVVTAIIMGVALPDNRTMTNDEIIARAKELGLVENTVLSNTGNADGSHENEANDRSDVEDAQDDLASAGSVIDTAPGMEDAAKEDGDAAEAGEGTGSEGNNTRREDDNPGNTVGEKNPEPGDVTGEEEKEDTTVREGNNIGTENSNEAVTSSIVKVITVNSGDSSYTVAKKLADAGVVTSAEDFDAFLCQHGYDKRLRTGSFSIPADVGDEQIARIITGAE